ncbi:MAG: hypothetical protein JXR12_06400 [Neptunomonas phycophila]|uniref:hypothetical protein n=1 Tax=Neptunomonas phycophila TaxID=1572645 RepID=UPI003B8AD4C3
MSKDIDITKPFAVMIYDKDGEFGLYADQNGAITARPSKEAFVLDRKESTEGHIARHNGSYESAMSAALFGMSFTGKAIMVEDGQHITRLIQEYDPDFKAQLKGIGNVAGRTYIITIPREPFEELLKDATDVGL